MRTLRALLSRIVATFDRRRAENDFAMELESHVELAVDEYVRAGVPEDEARRLARIRLGGVESTKESFRDRARIPIVESVLQDLRYGVRSLRKDAGLTTVALLSLMLGIGANAAVFQLVDAVRLRSLPVPNADELAEIRLTDHKGAVGHFQARHPWLTRALWESIRTHQQGFSSVAAWSDGNFNLERGGELREAQTLLVSGGYFSTLGVRPAAGRLLGQADDTLGAAPAAVLSDAFWRREYGGDPAVLGRTLTLEGHPVEIVGVTEPSFFGFEPGHSFDVAVSLAVEPLLRGEDSLYNLDTGWWLTAVGRRAPGWSIDQARAQLLAASPAIVAETVPPSYNPELAAEYQKITINAFAAGNGISEVREDYELALWLLLGITAVVLVMACTNLTNLLLARASTREREMAVRLALGAARGRLIRQSLTESLLLASAGALLGLGLARVLSQTLIAVLGSRRNPIVFDLGLDVRVFAFTTALAFATCVLFGLAPALRATRTSAGEALKAGGRGSSDTRERLGLRRVLVCLQVALSVVLVVGALLFVRSLGNLVRTDTGFRPDGLLFVGIDASPLHLPKDQRIEFKRSLVARLRSVPGIESVSQTFIVPLSGAGWNDNVTMEGAQRDPDAFVNFNGVGDKFFATTGTAILEGREFDERDTLSSPKVAVVNEEFVRRLNGGASPIGRRFSIAGVGNDVRTVEIVGLVANTKYADLREKTAPIAYVSVAQDGEPDQSMIVLVRPAAGVDVGASIRGALAEANPQLVYRIDSIDRQISTRLSRERLVAVLSGFFGVLALVLATIGLYGVTSYTVARRSHEIGIRMALGATRGRVASLVLGELGVLLAVGVAVGAVASLGAARVASTLLFGIQPDDPGTVLAAVGALALVTIVAGLAPTIRAASVDPVEALRQE